MITCKICQKENVPGAISCISCGLLLIPTPDTHRLSSEEIARNPQFRSGNYQMGEADVFSITLLHDSTMLPFLLQSIQQMVLGRRVSNMVKTNLDGATQSVVPMSDAEQQELRELVKPGKKPTNPLPDQTLLIDLGLHEGVRLGISRKHALLERQEDRIYLSDLNSTNKTYINGMALVPFNRRLVRDYDEIRIGDMRLSVRITKMETVG